MGLGSPGGGGAVEILWDVLETVFAQGRNMLSASVCALEMVPFVLHELHLKIMMTTEALAAPAMPGC